MMWFSQNTSYSFRGNFLSLNLEIVEIQIVAANFKFLPNKLNFWCGNYSREKTIQENMVC